MFITFTLNPAVDAALDVPAPLELNRVHAVAGECRTPGGKGINVAKMLAANGCEVVAAGLVGGDRLPFFSESLARLGIACRFLAVPHPTRVNLMVTDRRGHELKLNWPGFPELACDFEDLASYARSLVSPGDVVLLGGSLPARFPADLYARLIRLFHTAGCVTGLDAAGAALRAALPEKPGLIKPNRRELEEALDLPPGDESALRAALGTLMHAHEVAIVSDGPRGAWFASQGRLLFAPSPEVERVDSTGAGDSLFGQFCADYFPARQITPEIAARAVAAGAAAVEQPGTPVIARARVLELAARVRVRAG